MRLFSHGRQQTRLTSECCRRRPPIHKMRCGASHCGKGMGRQTRFGHHLSSRVRPARPAGPLEWHAPGSAPCTGGQQAQMAARVGAARHTNKPSWNHPQGQGALLLQELPTPQHTATRATHLSSGCQPASTAAAPPRSSASGAQEGFQGVPRRVSRRAQQREREVLLRNGALAASWLGLWVLRQ